MVQAPATSEIPPRLRDAADRSTAPPPAGRVPVDHDTADLRRWLAERQAANRYVVRRVPFADLDHWNFDLATGNLRHSSGQFFTVEGLTAHTDYGGVTNWSQPIIDQPEIGILGILVRELDGVMHCLMQAKMEPGNINMIQISPTVQATRSNVRRVHQGNAPRYLEHFSAGRRGRVLVDVLQSEQGAWFYGKRNRNMVVEADGDVPEHPDFRWIPLHQLRRLLAYDDLVNMDTRTVLACMPFGDGGPAGGPAGEFTDALRRSFGPAGALHPTSAVLSWFSEQKLHREFAARLIPLDEVESWHRTADRIARDDGRFFSIVGAGVEASNREVRSWTQPLLAPSGVGLVAFIAKPIGGVLHLLAHARVEAGYRDVVEFGPTVQSTPDNYADPSAPRPRYLDHVLSAPLDRIRFDAVQSDEGGRLYHARNRHVIVEVGDDFPVNTPDDHVWLTVSQLTSLMRRSYHVNIQGRSLLACLSGLR